MSSPTPESSPLSERRPIVELLLLAAPTVAQMASYTLMQFADRYMLGRVGSLESAAAGTAGLMYFSVIGFGFGVMLVINTLVSQNFGRNDLAATGQYLWQGLWFGAAFGLVAMLMAPLAGDLFLAMGHEPRMAALEADYLRIVALGGPVKLAAVATGEFLLGLHRPGVVFVATVAGVACDLALNYVLIFGNLGFPAMGIEGAAWSTNLGVCVELLAMWLYVFRPSFARLHATRDWRLRPDKLARLLRVGAPAGFQLICDIFAWNMFMNFIVAGFGTAALAANSFAFAYMHVCFMPAIGVGTAVTASVGKYIGMGRHDLAARRAHLGFFVCAAYMVLAGLALYVFRRPLLGLFTSDPEILRIGGQLMLFVALYQLFDAMFVVYIGALRGAGDTLVPAVFQAVMVWSVVVGGGALMVRYAPQLGVAGPWTLATGFGACLGLFLLVRFQRGGWRSIVLEHAKPSDTVRNLNLAMDS